MSANFSVSKFGLQVLQKINVRKGADLLPDGRIKVGPIIAPPTVSRVLLARDLIEKIEDNRVRISSPGEMFLKRINHLKKKIKDPTSPYPGDLFKAQHAKYSMEVKRAGRKNEKFVRNIGNMPLSWLHKRRDQKGNPFISRAHLEAGEKLSEDFEYAGQLPRTTTFYDGVPIGKTKGAWKEGTLTERQLQAKQRVDRALSFVGPGLSDILVRVCCFHEGLEQAERTLSWPTRSGKIVLKIALDWLVDYYKIKN